MNAKQLILLTGLFGLAAGFAGAAEKETRHVETRVFTAANAEVKRDPVTYLGVSVTPAAPALAAQLRLPEGQGLVVNFVEPDSPAAKGGLKQHDLLLKLEDQILIEPRQLAVLVRARKEGETVTLTYLRGGAEARASVTLATHVPGPEPFMQWIGSESPDVLFRFDHLDRPHGIPGAATELITPGPGVRVHPAPRPVPHASESRVMIFRPKAGVVLSDEEGSLSLRVDEKGQVLTAKNAQGDVVFDGPVGTPEQRAAMPEDLRRRLEKLEGMDEDVFEAAVPAPVPAIEHARPATPVL